jgi:hypothetical protein
MAINGIGSQNDVSDEEYLNKLSEPAYLLSVINRDESGSGPGCKFCRFFQKPDCSLSSLRDPESGIIEIYPLLGFCDSFRLVEVTAREVTDMIYNHLTQDESI